MQDKKDEKTGAVIAAGGSGQRMGDIDKLFGLLDGKAILARVIDVFQNCNTIDQIVVVLSRENLEKGKQLLSEYGWTKIIDICTGGERRQDSVAAGLSRLNKCDWVVIHDGVRPLITGDLIEHGLEVARETGAAIAAVPVTETIKIADDELFIQGTPPRNNLWVAQTPQIFRFDLINEAYKSSRYEVTDDARLVEQLGHRVKIYMGSYDNIKITTPEDMALAGFLWQKREKER